MASQEQVHPIDKIEIYTDASWLHPGKSNHKAAGGWGAVIVEHRGSVSTVRQPPLSGPTPENVKNNVQAEFYAALAALQDVASRFDLRQPPQSLPPVSIYVDETSTVDALKALGKNLFYKSEKYGEEVRDIAALMKVMNVSIYQSRGVRGLVVENPSTPEQLAALAHALANQAACLNRLELQQGKIYFGRAFEGDEARRVIEKMSHPTVHKR